jgi:hypothetical protein
MPKVYLIDNHNELDLTKEVVDLIRDRESMELVARSMGNQAINEVLEADDDVNALYLFDAKPDDNDPVNVRFTPKKAVVAQLCSRDIFTNRSHTEIAQVISGEATIADEKSDQAILTVPIDTRFPAELELRDKDDDIR